MMLLLLALLQDDVLDTMKERIGDGAVVEKMDDVFYLGTDGSKKTLERGRRTVESVVGGLYKHYFKTKTDKPLKVYLFSDEKSYEAYCVTYMKKKPSTPYGFYLSSDRALIMNIATGTGTLAHELVHPLLAADFEDVPSWFNEGFASLLEQSTTKDDGTPWGLPNWRLPNLQKQLKAGTAPTLEEVMKTSTTEFYDDDKAGIHYAVARYLCLYLQEHGQLKEFYKAFHDGFAKDKTGVASLERITGKSLKDLQAAWETWTKALKYEP